MNAALGLQPLPHDFTGVAIKVFSNNDIHDDCSTSGCPYINELSSVNADDTLIWNKYYYYRETTKEAVAASIGESADQVEALGFHEYEWITDADIARAFEGVMSEGDFFTPE